MSVIRSMREARVTLPPTKPENILVVSFRSRDTGRLDSIWRDSRPGPTIAELRTATPAGIDHLVLGGGEPTLRPDFPLLVEQFGAAATVATDGLALHSERTVSALAERGLRRVRIPIHSARPDAHDWLGGIPGSHRRIRRAIPTLHQAQISVEAEVALARPTVPYLPETVAFLLRCGIRHIRFRSIHRVGPMDHNYVTTAARYGLMQPSLDAAMKAAIRAHATVEMLGVPECAIPGFSEFHIPPPRHLLAHGVALPYPDSGAPVAECPCKWDHCRGASQDYCELFGWSEFDSEASSETCSIRAVERPQSGEDAAAPPGRTGRQPTTRIADIVRLAGVDNVGGNPMAGRKAAPTPAVVAVRFPKAEPTRAIKMRLVQAAQQGAHTLQIAGEFTHPDSVELIREALRLSFPRVVLTGNLQGLSSATNRSLFKLRGLSEVWSLDTPESVAVAQRIEASAKVAYRTVKNPGNEDPVSLYGPAQSAATTFENGFSWPQWRPNAVHYL